MQEMWVRSMGWEDTLEKEMTTHSGIPAWRIPQTEETGAMQSMGLQRVRHDWAQHTHIIYAWYRMYDTIYILYRNYLTLLSGTSFQVLLRDVLQTCFHFTLHNIKMLPQKPKELHDMKSYCLYSDMAKYCLHFWISPIVTCGFLWEIVN